MVVKRVERRESDGAEDTMIGTETDREEKICHKNLRILQLAGLGAADSIISPSVYFRFPIPVLGPIPVAPFLSNLWSDTVSIRSGSNSAPNTV